MELRWRAVAEAEADEKEEAGPVGELGPAKFCFLVVVVEAREVERPALGCWCR